MFNSQCLMFFLKEDQPTNPHRWRERALHYQLNPPTSPNKFYLNPRAPPNAANTFAPSKRPKGIMLKMNNHIFMKEV